MSWFFHEFLHVDTIILKGGSSFSFGRIVSTLHFTLFPHNTHTFSTATGSGFKNNWVADFPGQANGLIQALQQSFASWYNGYTCTNHRFLGGHFIAHATNLI